MTEKKIWKLPWYLVFSKEVNQGDNSGYYVAHRGTE